MHRIPCIEDFRNYQFPHMPAFKNLSNTQRTAVSSFVDSMTVPYVKDMNILTFNASLLAIHQESQKRALESSSDIFVKSPFVRKESKEMISSAKLFAEVFPLEINKQKVKRRKMYWAQDFVVVTEEAEIKTYGDDLSSTISESRELPIAIEISVQSPIEDFNRLLSEYKDLETRVNVFTKMTSVIEDLIMLGGKSAHFRKATTSLQALRKASISDHSPNIYNSFLQSVIKSCQHGEFQPFWKDFFVIDTTLSLISKNECVTSDISETESKEFLSDSSAPIVHVSLPVNNAGDDDIFGEME